MNKFEDSEKRPSLGTAVTAIVRCGNPDCGCARYTVAAGLTLQTLLEDVRRDNAGLVHRLQRHARGGADAMSDKERVVWQRLGKALSPGGRVSLIDGKCIWSVHRSRLLSGLKDVNAGRYERGFRRDVRPDRRPGRDQPDRRGERPRVREHLLDPQLLATLRDSTDRADDPLELVIDGVPPTELLELVHGLTPRLREAIELELARVVNGELPALTSTQRVRHFRAARKLAELILERPELAHLHAVARALLAKERRCD